MENFDCENALFGSQRNSGVLPNLLRLYLRCSNSEFSSFRIIAFILLFRVPLFANVRIWAFDRDYMQASRFLKFCFWMAVERSAVVSAVGPRHNYVRQLILMPPFQFLLLKYFRYSRKLKSGYWDDPERTVGGLESLHGPWSDSEFDWLVQILLNIHGYRGVWIPREILQLEWSGDQYYAFLRVTSGVRLARPVLALLGFDYSRKFSANYSMFRNWESKRGVSSDGISINISNRFMFSFQVQFNYSDFSALDFHISNFQHIHVFNPIFTEMYGLPFLLPGLRPAFVNPSMIHTYNMHEQLHYAAVYALGHKSSIVYIFDKYLYDHARLLLMLPARYMSFPQVQYAINVFTIQSTVQPSNNVRCISRYFSVDYMGYTRSIFEGYMFSPLMSYQYFESSRLRVLGHYFRQKIILQTIINCWIMVSKVQKQFEIINYFFFRIFSDSSLGGYRDSINTFIGLLESSNFDRVTRRVLSEFVKYLYASPLLVDIFLFRVSEEQLIRVNSFGAKNGLFGSEPSNMLTELEIGYHGLGVIHNVNREHFASLASSVPEQLHDYELWLYAHFSAWYTLVNRFELVGKVNR